MQIRGRHLALFAVLCCLSLSVVIPVPSAAHLCVIRQGAESGGQPELNNKFGTSLAVGDFNGDGFEDLASGAPGDGQGDPSPGLDGALTVNYGSKFGLTHVGAQYITIGDVPDVVVRFGQSVAAGNFNNDAYDDLAVGAPDLDVLSATDAGAVFIYLGGPLGLPSTATMVYDQEDIGEVSENGDRWGWSLCTGDFDGDTYDDLGVGAIGEDLDLGSVSALYGSGFGLTTINAQTFRQTDLGGLPSSESKFGWALTAGNLAGTSHDELVASAPYEEVMAFGAGRVYVIPGSGTGLDGANANLVDGATTGVGISSPGPNEFGYSLAVGDFPKGSPNFLELVIGEPGFDEVGKPSSGRVVIGTVDSLSADSAWIEISRKVGTGGQTEAEDRYGTSVATGKFFDVADSFDHVAVGAPGFDMSVDGDLIQEVGRFFLYFPTQQGIGLGQFSSYGPIILNDQKAEFNSQIGMSMAFGEFDEFGRESVAVGAPEKNFQVWVEDQGPDVTNAGQVYVFAPWRQVRSLRSRTAIAVNCEGEIVFSQRPFTQSPIASVTKTMTGLLACEAVASGYDSTSVHSAPAWLNSGNTTCNCWPFVETQETKFMDLVRITMGKSSNDASYAVADMLTGPLTWSGKDSTAADFVDDMNARAAQLGMNRTLYSNPAGYDVTHYALGIQPYSTAYDQSLLAQAAMENTCLSELFGTDSYTIRTFYPSGSFLNFNIDVTVDHQLTNSFKTGLADEHPDAAGVKGGLTDAAQFTAQYSVLNTMGTGDGYVVGAAFGFEENDQRFEDGADLMNLALGNCADGDSVPLPPSPPDDDPVDVFPVIPTCDSVVTAIHTDLSGVQYDPVTLTILPEFVTQYPVDVTLRMFRWTLFNIPAGETVSLSLDRYRSSAGWKFTNVGDQLAELTITTGSPQNVNLNAGQSFSLPGIASLTELSETIWVENIGMGTTNDILIEAVDRKLPLSLANAGDRQDISFGRSGFVTADQLQIFIEGEDSECSNTISASFNAGYPSTTNIGSAPYDLPGIEMPGRLLGSHPNPTSGESTIRYELTRPTSVRLSVYDLAGRLVRMLLPQSEFDPGEYVLTWDGRNSIGSRVAAGVYFVQLEMANARDTRRIVVVR